MYREPPTTYHKCATSPRTNRTRLQQLGAWASTFRVLALLLPFSLRKYARQLGTLALPDWPYPALPPGSDGPRPPVER